MSADSNRVALRYVTETTFGEVPAGSPKMKQVRLTGESLRGDASYTQSAEIRDDRQISDVPRVNIGASGDINYELSIPTYKDFIALALLADGASLAAAWSTQVDATGLTGVALAYSAGELTLTDTGSFTGFNAGEWCRLSGFSDAGNNGIFKIKTASANAITVYNPNGVTNASDDGDVRQASQVVNGTTFRSLYFEKQFTDLTNRIRPFTGMAIESWSMDVTPTGILGGAFSFVGKRELAFITSTNGDGTPTAAPTDAVCNAVEHVQAVYEGAGYAAYDITGLSFQLANNLRQRLQVATLGPISMGTGTVEVSGSVDAFFDDPAVANKFSNDTESALAFTIERGDYAMIIEFPRVKYESAQQTAGAINQDVINEMTFRAFRNATEDVTIRVGIVDFS